MKTAATSQTRRRAAAGRRRETLYIGAQVTLERIPLKIGMNSWRGWAQNRRSRSH